MRRWDGTDWWFLALITLLTLTALTYAAVGVADLYTTQETP